MHIFSWLNKSTELQVRRGRQPQGTKGWKFDVNRNLLSLQLFATSLKIISLKSDFIQFFHDFKLYIAPGKGLTTPWGWNFDVYRNILSLRSFAVSLKKISLKSDWYNFFHDIIHVYSPRAGADSPQGTKLWRQQKCRVTSFTCWKFKKKFLWSLILYKFFHDLIHVYSPRAGVGSPQETKFWFQQKGLITLLLCCKFQRNLFEVWLYTIFFMI